MQSLQEERILNSGLIICGPRNLDSETWKYKSPCFIVIVKWRQILPIRLHGQNLCGDPKLVGFSLHCRKLLPALLA